MRVSSLATISRDRFSNTMFCLGKEPHSTLFYVIELANWSIKWDGRYITECLRRRNLLSAKITTTHRGIKNQIIHFGSRTTFLPKTWEEVDLSNKIVFTWFHGTEEHKDPANLAMIKVLPEASTKADIVHTSCTISKENLIRWGVPEKKIVVVPLGVDLAIFRPITAAQKDIIKKELKLPQDKIIIGSFQKDGIGWGEGMEPKWEKGADIFVKVLDKLKAKYDIFVLLLGPARGYVKEELNKIGVPYKHLYLKNYAEIPRYYNTLDLYLVTSRAEGGPKAILESMATRVPIVSTQVGMASDLIKEDYNGLLAKIDDVAELSGKAENIISNKEFSDRLAKNALNTITSYSWDKIAREYYEKIYKRFLKGYDPS